MKITIVTVCFNSVMTIEDTIKSILYQEYKNVELIVIDGGSTDGTLDILRSYSSIIHILVSEPDRGIYDAMNKGINFATGDIIGVLNSDDILFDSHILSDIAIEFMNSSDLDIIYGNIVYVRKNDSNRIVRTWVSKGYYEKYFEDGNVPPHPSLYIRRSIYINSGNYDTRYTLAADYDFMLRVFKKYAYVSKYLNRTFVKMRLGGASNRNFKNILVQNFEVMKSWKRNGLSFPIFFFPKKFIKRVFQFSSDFKVFFLP
jgi:glycosyltransferase involved in cell wall biosynthesis